MKENIEKNREKKRKEKIFRKKRIKFKIFILYVYSNSFYLFLYYLMNKKFKKI